MSPWRAWGNSRITSSTLTSTSYNFCFISAQLMWLWS
jgi:hypothetical protein